MLIRVVTLVLSLALYACSSLSPDIRRQYAYDLAKTQQWQRITIPTQTFEMVAYLPKQFTQQQFLTLYIEGDGMAWVSRQQLSSDPTPKNPLALKLALKHPGGNAAYLARPCQYVLDNKAGRCAKKYWSSHRFSNEVVSASNSAVSALKKRFQAKKIVLVGYSGGGAVAALVAARRNDVAQLITIAGNLDHKAWTKHHHISPLSGSLNPAEAWRSLLNTPQLHLVGSKDTIIPPFVSNAYQQHFPNTNKPNIKIIDGYHHHCCWAKNWAEIFSSNAVFFP